MISTYLVVHSWAVPLALLLTLLGCVALGTVALRIRRGDQAMLGLAVLAGVTVLVLTLSPSDFEPETVCTVHFAWPFWRGVETLANIALALPVAYFVALLVRRPVTVAVVASASSAVIELIQALLPVLGRSCDTTDWQMNTIGAVMGAGAAWLTYTLRRTATEAKVSMRD